jgi:ornithine carbamoyltransferase
MMRHLLSLAELSTRDIQTIFRAAARIKARPARYASILRGKTVAMIFQKPSTRTRVSFETGIYQMGGNSLYLAPNDLQLGRGETVGDTARVLSRFVDSMVARVYAQEDVEEMARCGSVPVINGLSDRFHPCQAIADYFTLLEKKRDLRGLKLAYVGDGNNVANSLIEGAAKLGVYFSIACPDGYEPDPEVIKEARKAARKTKTRIEVVRKPSQAVRGADAVYTDVWTSMGQEAEEQKRRLIFQEYQVSTALFRQAKPDAVFMHCLPAHRGDEVASEVMDSAGSIVFDQAENRLHTQKAMLFWLLSQSGSDGA